MVVRIRLMGAESVFETDAGMCLAVRLEIMAWLR